MHHEYLIKLVVVFSAKQFFNENYIQQFSWKFNNPFKFITSTKYFLMQVENLRGKVEHLPFFPLTERGLAAGTII